MRLIRERRNLLICIAAVILSLAPLPAKSDPIRRYQAVQIAYDEAEKVLRVAIVPVELQWNDYAGMERLEEEKNCFVLWNRISYDEDQFIQTINPAVRTYETYVGEIVVKVFPVPGNINGNGRCGAHMGAAVSVSLNGVVVVERRRVISSNCNSRGFFPFSLPLSR